MVQQTTQTTQTVKQPAKTTQPVAVPVQQTTGTQPTQEPVKKVKWWVWVLVVLLSFAVGFGIAFLLF